MKAVLMPALGVAMTEGLVVRWLKQPGDSVAEGEPLLEIETDKSIVEVPSPATGLLGPLLFAEGDVVPTGVAVTHVSDGSADPDTTGTAAAAVSGVAVADAPPPASSATPVRPGEERTPEAGIRAPHTQSPRQRRLARERAAAAAGSAASTGTAAPGAGPDVPATPTRAAGRYRALIAAKVVESWTTIPHFSVTREVDAGAMVRLRTRYDTADRPGFTDLMLLALAHALRASGEPGSVDVGLAVATPNGVAIPVLRGVLDMDLGQLRREREAAVERARQDRLRPDDLRDAPRSTLSNLGTLGVDAFTGVIAVGQTSLLTVGRILARPFVSGATVAIRDSFHATLNADHRVLDGEEAARLLVDFVNAVEQISDIAGSGGRS